MITYTDPEYHKAVIEFAIRKPISSIVGKRDHRSQPHVAGHETRKARQGERDPLVGLGA